MGKGGGTFDRLLGTLIQRLLYLVWYCPTVSQSTLFTSIVLTGVVGLWLSGQLANFTLPQRPELDH